MRAFHITSQQHSLRLPLCSIVTSEPLLRPVLNQLNHSNQVNQRLPAVGRVQTKVGAYCIRPSAQIIKKQSACVLIFIINQRLLFLNKKKASLPSEKPFHKFTPHLSGITSGCLLVSSPSGEAGRGLSNTTNDHTS